MDCVSSVVEPRFYLFQCKMASGVFVDPSTDQRMISTGMDRRSGNGMVDLGMVADGTVCGDEKVSIFIQH